MWNKRFCHQTSGMEAKSAWHMHAVINRSFWCPTSITADPDQRSKYLQFVTYLSLLICPRVSLCIRVLQFYQMHELHWVVHFSDSPFCQTKREARDESSRHCTDIMGQFYAGESMRSSRKEFLLISLDFCRSAAAMQ